MANFLITGNVRRKGKSYNQDIREQRVEATSLHAAVGKAARAAHSEFKGERLEKMTIIATRI